MDKTETKTCWQSPIPCPKCGTKMDCNGRRYWCSACGYEPKPTRRRKISYRTQRDVQEQVER